MCVHDYKSNVHCHALCSAYLRECVSGEGGVGITSVHNVSVHNCVLLCFSDDSPKMKGRMEAENLSICYLRKKKISMGCHGVRPWGTGVHNRCLKVNALYQEKRLRGWLMGFNLSVIGWFYSLISNIKSERTLCSDMPLFLLNPNR